ncbi:hypothetical protein [Kordia sp.]|uniref:hypothetical protein n=1 Tax=Kordia sp. TaxID=1965332 RepID=UPI003D2A5C18
MIKYIFLILFSLTSTYVSSQKLETLPKDEKTVYIYFSSNDNHTRKTKTSSAKGKMKQTMYYYSFSNIPETDCNRRQSDFWITTSNYKNFDAMFANKKMPTFEVNEQFLQENKNSIIDRAYMDRVGPKKTLELLRKSQHIFIIDENEKLGNRYIANQGIVGFIYEE